MQCTACRKFNLAERRQPGIKLFDQNVIKEIEKQYGKGASEGKWLGGNKPNDV